MRIAIANDSVVAATAMSRLISGTGQHEIAWVARTGSEAVKLCAFDRPDLILMDLLMPEMDGLEATRRIMAKTPCAILVVTASVGSRSSQVFDALGAGALDAVSTPTLGSYSDLGAEALLAKIHAISWVIGRAERQTQRRGSSHAGSNSPLVAVGASAGGPAALAEILGGLPPDFACPIIVIQHVDEEFAPPLAAWLDDHSKLPVEIAREGAEPQAGTVLIAGTKDHLVFKTAHSLGYTAKPENHSYRPSVDVFFRSVLRHWRGNVVGVLLTGMGRDGAKGLRELREAGYHTIAQDRETCVVYGMPKAAAEIDAAVEVLPLSKISDALSKYFAR